MLKPVSVSVVASQNSERAVSLQENLPIPYGSEALTKTDRRYSQIEKNVLDESKKKLLSVRKQKC